MSWLDRPYVDLQGRLTNLRQAAREQSAGVRNVLAERNALLGPSSGEQASEAQSTEQRGSLHQLDLRVRSASIHEGSASSLRVEMAEMISCLGTYRQLDAVSKRAYELIAAGENLLSLVRGDGWIFAHREILSSSEEVEQALVQYRRKLDLAEEQLEEKANRLSRDIARHLRYYQVSRFAFVILLLVGPLIGFWSGLQLAERDHHDLLTVRIPGSLIERIELLARGERLVQGNGSDISSTPWIDSTPEEQIATLAQDLEADLRWGRSLCRQQAAGAQNGPLQILASAQCNELQVRSEETRRALLELEEVLREQESLRLEAIGQMLAQIPAHRLSRTIVPSVTRPAAPTPQTTLPTPGAAPAGPSPEAEEQR